MSSSPITISFFTLFLFAACSGSDQVKISSDDEPELNLVSPAFYGAPRIWPASIHGEWSVRNIFMYSGVLQIKRDGSFTFYEGGCLGSSYSEGTWRGSGNTYVLQSLEKFKGSPSSLHRDSGYSYFNNEQFTLVGDTLYSCSISKLVMNEQY